MTNNQADEQWPQWVRWYLDGESLRQVGKRIDISRQQVANRLSALGIPLRGKAEAGQKKRERQLEERGEDIVRVFYRTRDVSSVASEVGVPPAAVRQHLDKTVPDYKVLAKSPRSSRKVFTTAEMVENLREAKDAISGVVTFTAYRDFVNSSPTRSDGRARPSEQAIDLRFGSWNAALDAAGLPLNPNPGRRR